MGVYAHAALVVGLPADHLLDEEVEVTTKTQYDVNTGIPYEVKNRRRFPTLFGKEICEDDIEEELGKLGLEHIYAPTAYIGKTIAVSKDDEVILKQEDINDYCEAVTNIFKSLGVDKPVSLVLACVWS